MKFNKLGDWCKWLEKNFSNDIMIPSLPVIIRLDGNNFHNWTKGLEKPYDENLCDLMFETTKFLVQETNAIFGYTQSDEITLVLYSQNKNKLIYNDGKKQKILSKLTAKCVQFFNEKRKELLPNHNKIAIFDARIYQVPTIQDAIAQIVWRENDAIKNSISMLAQANFSHKRLHKMNGEAMKELLLNEKGIDWDKIEGKYRKGRYVKKVKKLSSFLPEEVKLLPKNHNARKNPEFEFERNILEEIEFNYLNNMSGEERKKVLFEET